VNVVLDGVAITIDDTPIIRGVSLEVEAGHFHGLIGPNGSGKSTLLRSIYRSLRPDVGAVRLGRDDLWRDLSARTAARRRAVVTQDSVVELDFSVQEIVEMGRAPHKSLFERDNNHDRALVQEALTDVGMGWAADRIISTLSGGERQRVFLARALAQQAPLLVLDEPTNHLDVRAQVELLELIRSLGLTTIAALHDLDHAAGICDRVSVLQRGEIVASGPPSEVLTRTLIREVFGVDAHLGPHPLTGRLHIAVAALRSATNERTEKDHP
jgi:iron complex transport system ATP-binding protein